MKVLIIIFCIIYLLMFFFAKVKVNNMPATNVFQRAGVCLIAAAILTILIGLPILGIIYLIGGIV